MIDRVWPVHKSSLSTGLVSCSRLISLSGGLVRPRPKFLNYQIAVAARRHRVDVGNLDSKYHATPPPPQPVFRRPKLSICPENHPEDPF